MTTLTDLKCPNCGAGLPSPEPHNQTAVCEYCNASIAVHHHDTPEEDIPTQGFHVRVPTPQRVETPQDGALLQEVIARRNAANGSGNSLGCIVALAAVLILVGGIITLVLVLKGKDETRRKDMIAKSERESREREDKRLLERYRDYAKRFIKDREQGAEDMEAAVKKRIDDLLSQKEYPIPFHGSPKAKYRVVFFVPYVNHYADRTKTMELFRQKIMKEHPGLFKWYIVPMGHKYYVTSLTQVAAFELLKERGAKDWWSYFSMFTKHSDMGMPRTFQYILRDKGVPRDKKEFFQELNKLKTGFLHKIRRTGINADGFITAVKAQKHKEITDKIRDISDDLAITSNYYGGLILQNHIWKVGSISYRCQEIFSWIYPELNKKREELIKRGLTPPKNP